MSPKPAVSASTENAERPAAAEAGVRDLLLGGEFAQFRHATIMMIDDEPMWMGLARTFLDITGFRDFITVERPSEAIGEVRRHRPDILLLGYMMRGGAGYDILKILRADPDFIDLPVVILTSPSDATNRLQALKAGASDFLSKPIEPAELALRVRNSLAAKAYQDQLAYLDGLTGLTPHQLFHDRIESAIARAKRERRKFVLLHVIFDDFARVTADLESAVSDDLLRQLVRRLTANLRASDEMSLYASEDETLADVFSTRRAQFSVMLHAVKSVTGTAVVGHRILDAMRAPLDAHGTEVYLSPSIGIAGFPDDADDASTLVKSAVGASRLAGTQGEERLRFLSSARNEASRRRLRLESELRSAVAKGDLRLLYQPKIDVPSGAVVGAEALIRWPRTDGKSVTPSDFIAVAEETDMILPIGEWTLREASRQTVRWRDQGIDVKVAVNISATQFFKADLPSLVRSVLDETGLDPCKLMLEITERILIDRLVEGLEILGDLRAIGVGISIDDFGTGYSSLGFLKRFQADEVKIDKAIVAGLASSSTDRALVTAVTHLAHRSGLSVCAEGVEHARQLSFLQKLECDQYQGYLFDRPLDSNSFVARYRASQ